GFAFVILKKGGKKYRYAGFTLTTLVALVAVLKLIGLQFQLNIPIDYFLLRHTLLQDGFTGAYKMSMTVGAAVCFVLYSGILFLLSARRVKPFITGQV